MFSDFKLLGYRIYVLLTYAPIVVHTLKECRKKDVCICSTDEGVIDLRSLAGTGSDIPRFKDVVDRFGQSNAKLSWNPCNKWTLEPPAGTKINNCQDVAVCYNINAAPGVYIDVDVGEQDTTDYSYNETSGTCVLTLKGKPFPMQGPQSTSTLIFLQCDPHEEGRLESHNRTETGDEFKLFLNLHTKYACVKSGLSVGSILVITFISLLAVYLLAGILFNKYSKGATGKELIPNVNFWIDFPFLVKDGAVFSFQCCRSFCSRKQGLYESI